MPEQFDLPDVSAGEPIRAGYFNAVTHSIREIAAQFDGHAINAKPANNNFGDERVQLIGGGFIDCFIATIQATGPGGETFTTSQYYVERQSPNLSLTSGSLFDSSADTFANSVSISGSTVTPTVSNIYVATNLAELPPSGGGSGTHALAVGTRVQCITQYARPATATGEGAHQLTAFYHLPGILYGQLSADWTSGNSITVTRVADSSGTALPGTAITDTVILWCVWTGTATGPDWEPWGCYLQSGNIIAYRVLDASAGTFVAINPPWLTAGDSGGATQYQGYFDDSTGHALRDDLAARP